MGSTTSGLLTCVTADRYGIVSHNIQGGGSVSDTSPGEGWWQASDGKWYPPEASPASTLPPAPSPPPAAASPPAKNKKKPLWRRRWFVVVAALLVIMVIASIASSSGEDDTDAAGSGASNSDTTPDEGAASDDSPDESAPDDTTPPPPSSEADDVLGCRVIDGDNIELEVVNNSSETSSYFITTVYRDASGTRLGDEFHIVSNLRPNERTIESTFGFDVAGTTCEAADVDRFSAQSDDDELDDAVSCTITGRDVFDDLSAEVVVTNDSSQTSNYLLEVAFVREDGVRVGTGSATINAVAEGETAPGDVFTTVEAEAARCEIVSVQRLAS